MNGSETPDTQAAIPITAAMLKTWGIGDLVSKGSGITWQELATLPTHDLIRKHGL